MADEFGRVIALPGVHNVRDLGGYPITSGGVTRWREIFRADDLARLTDEGAENLVGLGLRTVIDLRGPAELELRPNPFREHPEVAYHNIPLFDAMAPIAAIDPDGEPFDMAKRYRLAIDRCQHRIANVLRTIAEAKPGIVLFHCSAGKDRTGIVAALILSLAGVDAETVVDDYALTATVAAPLLAEFREAAISRGSDPVWVDRFLASDAPTMRLALSHVDQAYGGVDAYLATLGLDVAVLDRLRDRLRDAG